MSKLPGPDVLMELLETMTAAEIGEKYGVSRQAVSFSIRRAGYKAPRTRAQGGMRRIGAHVKQGLEEGQSLEEVAEQFNIGVKTIRSYADRNGIKYKTDKVKRPYCPNCETDHYSRGLCRKCYDFAKRHDMLDLFPRKRNRGPKWLCNDCGNTFESIAIRPVCRSCASEDISHLVIMEEG